MNTYDVGDAVRVSVTFTDTAGAAIDPTVVRVGVEDGNGSATTYTYGTDAVVVKDSAGHYHADIPVTARGATGIWHYTWTGSGNAQGAGSGAFAVRKEEVG